MGCPPDRGRLHTCYSPVRHSPARRASSPPAAVQLACVKPAASVHPEPGSNSPLLVIYFYISSSCFVCPGWFKNGIFLTGNPELPRVPLSLAFPDLAVGAACLVASCHCSQSLSQSSSLRWAFIAVPSLFPDCGCKISAFFLPPQIFFQEIYVLQHIFAESFCNSAF